MGEILNDQQLVELRYRSGLDAFDSWSHSERVALLDTCGHWQQRAEAAERKLQLYRPAARDSGVFCGPRITPPQVPDEVLEAVKRIRKGYNSAKGFSPTDLLLLCDHIAPPEVPLPDVTISGETWREIERAVNPLACVNRGRSDCDCAHCKLRRLISGATP